jgi:PilZ domain-containing protein
MSGSQVKSAIRGSSERRKHARFPLALEMTYFVVDGARRGEKGISQTIDVSSSGLRFLTAYALPVGAQVDVVINWPISLDGHVPLQLSVSGTVVRLCGNETVLSLQRHAFKTRRTGKTLVPIVEAIHAREPMQCSAPGVAPQRTSARARMRG